MPDFGLMGGSSAIEFYPCESLEVVVAAVYAESSLVVEELAWDLEVEAAV